MERDYSYYGPFTRPQRTEYTWRFGKHEEYGTSLGACGGQD